MKVYTDSSDIKLAKHSVVTIGTFDGVHQGHFSLLETTVELARELDGESFIITFDPHPRSVVSDNYEMSILTTLEEKIAIFDKMGLDNLLVINFTEEFSKLSYEEFVKKYLIDKLNASHLVIGYDHKFGKDRDGDEKKLVKLGEKFGFRVTTVSAVSEAEENISSTKIRSALSEGDLFKATEFLGRNYSFTGTVVEGAERGRILGFPTANLKLDNKNKLVPAKGVYIVECRLNDENYFGLLNIGLRPTFEADTEIVIEVHLLDFNRMIYGEKMELVFIERIRDEKKFNSQKELVEQINIDKKYTIERIKNTN